MLSGRRGAIALTAQLPPKAVTAALGILMCALVVYSRVGYEPDRFGYLHDDSLYLTTAQSIASGEGFTLPSLPIDLPATKYPPLFPALLTAAWGGDLAYPQNLAVAQSIVTIFGVMFIPVCYLVIRKFGAEPGWAVAITGLAVFNPMFLLMQMSLASEVVFFALAYGAVICFETSTESSFDRPTSRFVWGAGAALCLAATLTRSLGLGVAIGAAIYLATQRKWARAAGAAAVGVLAILLPAYWASTQPLLAAEPLSDGFFQTITYYTSYLKFWGLSLPSKELWTPYVLKNLFLLLVDTGRLAIPLPSVPPQWFALIFGLRFVAAVIIFVEVARRILAGQGRCLDFALLPYCGVLLLWNYPLMWRFELVFLPLFVWNLKQAFSRLNHAVSKAAASPGLSAERVLAYGYRGAAICCLVASVYAYLWQIPRQYSDALHKRSAELAERRQAFDWLQANSSEDETIIAYEDAVLYLETGRKSIRPINLTTRCAYFPENGFIEPELALLADTARAVNARYWLSAADDYGVESAATSEALKQATIKLLQSHQEVFRSSGGRAVIYELSWPR